MTEEANILTVVIIRKQIRRKDPNEQTSRLDKPSMKELVDK